MPINIAVREEGIYCCPQAIILNGKLNPKNPIIKLQNQNSLSKVRDLFCRDNQINRTNEPSAILLNIIHNGPIETRIILIIANPEPQTIPKKNSNDSGSNFFFIFYNTKLLTKYFKKKFMIEKTLCIYS